MSRIRFAGRIKSVCLSIPAMAISPQVAYRVGELLFRTFGMRRKRESIDLSRSQRAIVVKLDEIGDMVLTSPFLRELRRNMPAAWITLVVKPEVKHLVDLCPYVNEVLTYDARTRARPHKLRRHWRALSVAWKHLWRRRFDLAILPRWDTDHYHAAFLLYFSGAPVRVGYSENVNDRKRTLNTGFDRLFTHLLHDDTPKHEVDHNLDVIRFLGGTIQDDRLELWTGQEDEIFADETLTANCVRPGEMLIAFGPGAGHPHRMWPLANFLKLGDWLRGETQARIVVVGGHNEKPLGEELQRQLGETVINVVGKTTLRQAGAILRRCQLYVGNDAGPMHLAAAASVPVVEISCHPRNGSLLHDNSPVRFAPWGVSHRIHQPEFALSPCSGACTAAHGHCIRSINPEQVMVAIMEQLSSLGLLPLRT